MLDSLNQTETEYPGTNLVLRYQRVTEPNPGSQEA